MPQTILHVGTEKAGSTSLQNFFDAQRAALRERGVLFPASVFTRKVAGQPERTSGHLQLLRDLEAGDISGFETERKSTPHETLLLSAENIFHYENDDSLALLGRELEGGDGLTLVAVLRRQDAWLASYYAESIQGGWNRETRSFDRFAEALLASGKLDYAAHLERMRRLLKPDRVIVIDYDAARRAPGGLLGAFVAATGLPFAPDELSQARRSHVTRYLPEALEAHRRLNAVARAFWTASMHAWNQAMLEAGATASPRERAGHPPELSPGTARSLRAALERSNADLSRRYLGGADFGPDPRAVPAPPPARDAALVDRLVGLGLGLYAEELGRASTLRAKPHELLPPVVLEKDELLFLHAELGRARRVIGYEAGAICTLAALQPACLGVFAETDLARSHARQAAYDALDLPSTPHILHAPGGGEEVWRLPQMRRPDLVLLPDSAAQAGLADCADRARGPLTAVVYPDGSEAGAGAGPEPAERVGRLRVFRFSQSAPRSAGGTAGLTRPGASEAARRPGAGGR